jgi:hypothetical protein
MIRIILAHKQVLGIKQWLCVELDISPSIIQWLRCVIIVLYSNNGSEVPTVGISTVSIQSSVRPYAIYTMVNMC